MLNPEAARLAEALRAAMKSQNLNGADIADAIERLTGERPGPMQVSRWLRAERPLIRVSPDLKVVAAALKLDPIELACDAIRTAVLDEPITAPNPYQTPDCQHPNGAGRRCPACCDDCNSDDHLCQGCGEPVGHNATHCRACNEE